MMNVQLVACRCDRLHSPVYREDSCFLSAAGTESQISEYATKQMAVGGYLGIKCLIVWLWSILI